MRKLDKRDKINILIIILSFFVLFFIIILNGQGVYASHIDFSSQHYMIPEYFRKLFYKTKDIFPSFAFNLGQGQNIYNFSYYGLLSPIVFISYLFPHLNMLYFINISSIIIVIISIILFYKFISGYTDNKNIRFISTFLLLLATPLIFHTHRHFMFINYMPFLLLSLFGVEKYIKENKKNLLIISTFLIIMTSYFFSVPSILTILLYGVFLFIKENEHISFKELFIKTFKLGLTLIIPVLMSMVLILPSFYAILSNRFEEKGLEVFSMFIPDFSFNNVLYDKYSLGLTAVYIFAVSYMLIIKNKAYKVLGIISLLLMFIPFINYILNGFMYLNGKVFIPFIPIGLLLTAKFLTDLLTKQIDLKKIILITTIISIAGLINFKINVLLGNIVYYYLADFLIIIITIILLEKKQNYIYLLLVFPVIISLIINVNDHLEDKEVINNQYDKNITNEIVNINKKDTNLYRTIDDSRYFQNANNIRDISVYKNTMYSSLTNKNFKIFNWYLFEKENENRNDAIYQDNSNILYNIYTGSKYYIGNNPSIGYFKVSDKTYQNNDVFPLGYVNHNYMSEKDFNKLKYPYNVEALINYTIIKDNITSNYNSNLEEIPLAKDHYEITNKENKKVKYTFDKEYNNKIMIIRFNMDYTESCKVGDTYITINQTTNLLTCKGWKYHNKNYTFEYVISGDKIKNLDIEMSKGTFKISNIKVYTLDYNYIKNLKKEHDNLIIDKKNTKGDIICGKIKTDGGVLSLSIPYSEGYNIYIDGKKVKSEIVNKHMLGFKINKGNHNIKIIYKAPLLNYGKILSLLGLLIFIYNIYKEKGVKNEKNNNDSTMLQ